MALLPEALRSIQTAAKEIDLENTYISVDGVEPASLALSPENWQDSELGYIYCMMERAKTLGYEGKKPLFDMFFDSDFDWRAMVKKIDNSCARDMNNGGFDAPEA